MALITRQIPRIFIQATQGAAVRSIHNSTISNSPVNTRVTATLIPGDGVGPDLVYSVQEVFKAAGVPVDWESYFFSEVNPTLSAPLEDVTICSNFHNQLYACGFFRSPNQSAKIEWLLKESWLLPTIPTQVWAENIRKTSPKSEFSGELQTLNMKLRNELDLYANVVHVKSLPGVKCRHSNIDCVIIREQTEGEYSALEHESVPGVVECLKIVTAKKSQRIAKFAFDYAVKNNRKKVTAVHKANIMKLGDGLFLRSCEEVGLMAKLYPKIEFEKMIVDNCTMQMVSKPQQFDVMVTPNLYGNIVDNLASGLVGGAGVVSGSSYSADCVVFEPGARHTFSEAVGKNVANPTAMLLCASKLLRHVNLTVYSDMVRNAVEKVLQDGKVRTKDIGGQNSTQEFTYAVISNLELPKA
ncbi:hypothetical protein HUJ05_008306 [Dendroctonus ponderosae]|nr:hypothetical protein HUJ05_008306 [Dendroctonus ponderosae]